MKNIIICLMILILLFSIFSLAKKTWEDWVYDQKHDDISMGKAGKAYNLCIGIPVIILEAMFGIAVLYSYFPETGKTVQNNKRIKSGLIACIVIVIGHMFAPFGGWAAVGIILEAIGATWVLVVWACLLVNMLRFPRKGTPESAETNEQQQSADL